MPLRKAFDSRKATGMNDNKQAEEFKKYGTEMPVPKSAQTIMTDREIAIGKASPKRQPLIVPKR
jgi:hypothetical protein